MHGNYRLVLTAELVLPNKYCFLVIVVVALALVFGMLDSK